ncbi:Altered inheritance of mitochondria protein 18 mitochondrial [Hypocenomyce scalaris]|nr:Altered inheritance of mitochondria protein 18 mitochondrial [Hypocenomyce scalaris]
MSNKATSRLLYHSACRRHPPIILFLPRRFASSPRRSAPQSQSSSTPPRNPFDPIVVHRYEAERRASYVGRTYYAAAGAIVCTLATVVLAQSVDIPPKAEQCDAPPERLEGGRAVIGGVTGGTEVRKLGAGEAGQDEEEGVESVPTGTSTIPTFPKTIHLPASALGAPSTASPALPAGTGTLPPDSEYQLLGLGIRTVSFLGIQVYVVGLYIAISDIAVLQQQLIKRVAGTETATTLVADEKEKLREMLMDAEGSERIWGEVLKECGIRWVWRIVPTRNTDFAHLRDGWVRGITARSQKGGKEFEDQGFGEAVGEFKAVFGGAGRKGVKKGRVLLLERDRQGALGAWVEDGEGKGGEMVRLGGVRDERVGRLVWLGYLAGKNVSSEGARRSVSEGVLEYVGRPVGTVATQVV